MRRLSGLDAASLALEAAATPLHMTAVLVFDTSTVPGGYSYERLRHLLASRIHLVPPLLQQLQVVPGNVHRPVWVDAPTIDWDYHLPRVISTDALTFQQLATIAAELLEERLDRARCGNCRLSKTRRKTASRSWRAFTTP
jgi:diacylglycerol O-acyltransferase / wax synthase